ncbi:hypothetical protein Tco_0102124 [Tanacetum coccineum]
MHRLCFPQPASLDSIPMEHILSKHEIKEDVDDLEGSYNTMGICYGKENIMSSIRHVKVNHSKSYYKGESSVNNTLSPLDVGQPLQLTHKQSRLTLIAGSTMRHPKSDVRNTAGKDKQTPQGSARTTSVVDLEEFCEKHYEKLLPIMADKYEYELRKKEKLEEVKVRLDFGEARRKSTKAQS